MIDYTERLAAVMADVVRRVPALGFIDLADLLVFARFGRRRAGGAFATCHSLDLPPSEPDRYTWTDRRTRRVARQSEWFVVRSPEVRVGGRRIRYLVSFVLPRFADETLERSGKQALYPGGAPWIAKLDTIVHELYHIDPGDAGLRRPVRADGSPSRQAHSPAFHRDVAAMVGAYLATGPDPGLLEFLTRDFRALAAREGPVVATVFRTYPSFPQRFLDPLDPQPPGAQGAVVRLRRRRQPRAYTERDLVRRRFRGRGAPVPLEPAPPSRVDRVVRPAWLRGAAADRPAAMSAQRRLPFD
jgi:hypothetical protein